MPVRCLHVLVCVALAGASAAAAAGRGEFERIATLPNYLNAGDISEETVSEIVAATENGRTLVYTDAEREAIGFIDIGRPDRPVPKGTVPVGGEPTSVSVLGNHLALVAVNTSESFVDASGELVVVSVQTHRVIARLALGGQPDSLAISPDRRYAAIAIENERDEELCVGGQESGMPVPEDDDDAADACEDGGGEVGIIPQTAGSPLDTNGNLANPAGFLVIVDLHGGNPRNWRVRKVDLTGLSALAPSDPEPEFVDINAGNLAAVTLQENNHLVVVDLTSGRIVNHFGLGTVDLTAVDATEDGVISLSESLSDVPREPDAVAWVSEWAFATANEGDMFGGSRGFSVFNVAGDLLHDSGNSFERIAVQHGHYPEDRSENKGSEPEAVEFGSFGGKDYLFVGSERGSFVAVYRLSRQGRPRFVQLLPAPLGPEGLLAIPKRGLLVVSGEEDDPSFGVRSSVMIYAQTGRSSYPEIAGEDRSPVPFSALSGMDARPDGSLVAVWDSFYSVSKVFHIDPSRSPARVTDEIAISGGSGNYDPEGIALAPDGSAWIASEGNASGSRLNRLLQIDTSGNVLSEITLPDEIEACRKAERDLGDAGNTGTHGSGFEGVAVLGAGQGYKLLVAQQRGWDYTTQACEALDDDPDGSNPAEPGQSRIWIYDPEADSWDHVSWALAAKPANASWVGLSEITNDGAGGYVVIERDNRTGDFGVLKTLVRVSVGDLLDGVTPGEKSVYNLVPDLQATNGWITDKPEGLAIDGRGRVYLVTDNDGVDDWSGETWFLKLGRLRDLF